MIKEQIDKDEQLLVKRALEGDNLSRNQIVNLHQQNVYNLALKLTGRESEAECILQDTFLKVFEKLDSFRGDSRLGTWIHRIATNAALMRIRGKKNKYFIPIEEEINDDDTKYDLGFIAKSLELDPLEVTLNEELKIHLENAINNLPVNLRTAFVLKDLEELSMAQISRDLGKSVSAIKADLHRARIRLRNDLAEFVSGERK